MIRTHDGTVVHVTDVAQVVKSTEDLRNYGLANGKPAVLLIVSKQPNANVIKTVDAIRATLPQLAKQLNDLQAESLTAFDQPQAARRADLASQHSAVENQILASANQLSITDANGKIVYTGAGETAAGKAIRREVLFAAVGKELLVVDIHSMGSATRPTHFVLAALHALQPLFVSLRERAAVRHLRPGGSRLRRHSIQKAYRHPEGS